MCESHSADSAASLMKMITASRISQCIYAAAKLGIADLLADGPKSTHHLALLTSTHEPSLYRLLRMLASVGIFSELKFRCFQLTPIAQHLRSDFPGSLRAYSIYCGEDWHYRTWGEIVYSVKTGKPAFDHIFNMSIFDYFEKNPNSVKIFEDAMTYFIYQSASIIAKSYDFSQMKCIVNVGGGNGILLATILKANPHLRGILFDLPQVIESTRSYEYLKTEILSGRCQLVPGNFFESVLEGADAYIMKHVIHNWNDGQCIKILNNCFKAMPKNGKLLLIESIVQPGNEPNFAKIVDISMLILLYGYERNESEFKMLLQAAGFSEPKFIDLSPNPLFIIEGTRAEVLTSHEQQMQEYLQRLPAPYRNVISCYNNNNNIRLKSHGSSQQEKVSSTKETFSGFISNFQPTLELIKQIKEKSKYIMMKLIQNENFQEIAILAHAINRQHWHQAMQIIESLTPKLA